MLFVEYSEFKSHAMKSSSQTGSQRATYTPQIRYVKIVVCLIENWHTKINCLLAFSGHYDKDQIIALNKVCNAQEDAFGQLVAQSLFPRQL